MLDCRGLACPQPVLQAKKALEEQALEQVEVLVDNEAASINVRRFLGTRGFATEVAKQGADYLVKGEKDASLTPSEGPAPEEYTCAPGSGGRQLVFVRSETLGRGDDALGAGLMKNFLATLGEMGPALWRIIFVNGGVKLCVAGSPVLESLQGLVQNGVSILVCGTCLTHFGLLEQKQVGETTNMLDVVTSLQVADKVITV
ncbi:MAG: sulfurtransferase-like selenium metabolism protein YedF [Deltaproteobacteria bacterium]|nr:sulfurtransferase-like selenium metabolism protein YedF [Deltaproteobacteria bacterium]